MAYEIVRQPYVWGTTTEVHAPEGKVVYSFYVHDAFNQTISSGVHNSTPIFDETTGHWTGVTFSAMTSPEGTLLLICDEP